MPDMRFAPPTHVRIVDRANGLNQTNVRSYNERLVLSLLLQNAGISRLEIGQRTKLSAQTVSVIIRSLEQEGLIAKGDAQRGRVGPPTIPLSLKPDGAYAIGLNLSANKVRSVLIDFTGAVRYHSSSELDDRNAASQCLNLVLEAIRTLKQNSRDRVVGIGLTLPAETGEKSISESDLGRIQAELESNTNLPVFIQNDITAAANGESMFGSARDVSDYLYFYLGEKLHYRLILNHQIHKGNNAISSSTLDIGLSTLEKELNEDNKPTHDIWDKDATWPEHNEVFNKWQIHCNQSIKQTVESLAQFIDIKTVIISSMTPEDVSNTICQSLENELEGITATLGYTPIYPKAVGSASLPFISRFMV